MQETSLNSTDSSRVDRSNPAWYRALTLGERMGWSVPVDVDELPNHQVASQKLRLWKELAAFQNEAVFAQRLLEQHLTEQDLLALLQESPETLQTRIVPTPAWMSELTEVLEHADFSQDPPQPARFAYCFWPLIADGISRLRAKIASMTRQYQDPPIEVEAVLNSVLPDLVDRIGLLVNRTMALELNIARLQGLLQGDTAQDRFQNFVQHMRKPERLAAFFQEYPVLARLILSTIHRWHAYLSEFLNHLCADWSQIRATFFPDDNPGALIEVLAGAGDTHRGGRSVIKLSFRSGQKLVYKPRSIAIDVHFQALLGWLNARGDHPAFRTLRLIERKGYGWSEFVEARSCEEPNEVARFYQRQGAYLALLYALEATDFHYENVIAAGEHPILVDLEALFHSRIAGENKVVQGNLAINMMTFSVLRVGLLPQHVRRNEEHEGLDVSGMGGHAGQQTPYSVPYWQDVGTDHMRLIRQRGTVAGRDNRPHLNGQSVDLLAYCEEIALGFTQIYRLLAKLREELLAYLLKSFAQDEIRLILRTTQTYAELLAEGTHPDVLRDALDRERFFDHLWTFVEPRPYLSRVIPAERRDLLAGDIPIFLTTPGTCDISTSCGEILTDFLKEPGLASVQRRLQNLDEQDLQRQLWLIRASLATLAPDNPHISRQSSAVALAPGAPEVTSKDLLASAHAVGKRICEQALQDEGQVGWLGLSLLNERQWGIVPLGPDLYSGVYGVILFLSYLGALTHENNYTALARRAYVSQNAQLASIKKTLRHVGAFEGWGSRIYLLSHLGSLWQEPTLWDEAEETVELLAALVEQDRVNDIIGGSAGCLLALLSLYQVRPTAKVREAAMLCGDALLSRAQPMQTGSAWVSIRSATQPLTGFSHGAAGIGFSLLSLADLTGEERFWQGAQSALCYERSVFSREHQNWPDFRDLRTPEQKQAEEYATKHMIAWCHGAPGIGLSRLASLRYLDDSTMHEEIAAALATTIAHGFGYNHSLCHGDLGNLETLLVASQVLADPSYSEQLRRLTAQILESIKRQGWQLSTPLEIESPGLMTGLAGIGYELLRLAAPKQVPSVLLLAPPVAG